MIQYTYQMKNFITATVILSVLTFAYGFNCTEYVTGISEGADRGHLEFCHTVLNNHKVISDNQRVIFDNQRVVNDKLDALLNHFNVSTQYNDVCNISTNALGQVVFSNYTLTPPILFSMITLIALAVRQFIV